MMPICTCNYSLIVYTIVEFEYRVSKIYDLIMKYRNNGVFAHGKCVSSVESLTRRGSYLGFVFTRIVGQKMARSCGCFIACRHESFAFYTRFE